MKAMSDERVKELDGFNAPWGKQVILQEVAYDGGMVLMRMRIREGRRFTIIDVDADTAARWGKAMCAWADQSRRQETHGGQSA